MTVLASLRDTFEVARFELIRALRTWRAVALTLLFVVATTGAAFVFVGLLWVLEAELASTLGVPTTDRPGAMTGRLMESGELRRMLEAMIGEEDLVDAVLWHPVLALFHLWFCLLLGPFFATTSAAECIAVDNRTRALRFEVLRTGRLELVMGRFIGQVLLTSIAFTAAVLGPWIVGVFFMVGNDPLHLAGSLLWLTPRALAFSLPFVGVGVAASQLTTFHQASMVYARRLWYLPPGHRGRPPTPWSAVHRNY